MLKTKKVTIQDLKAQIANRIAEYSIPEGVGAGGTLEISLARGVVRTFRAHWTGFRASYAKPTIVMKATLADGSFWSEAYISPDQPSWVLCFRRQPHKSRGTGAERPDDKFASSQSLDTSRAVTASRREKGVIADEEIIRYEDFDDCLEAVDEFFTYTSFYIFRAVNADWSQFGFVTDEALRWDDMGVDHKAAPDLARVEEALKRSDIMWITVDTDPNGKQIPVWFLYSREKRLFVLSGEPEQRIPYASAARRAHLVVRWKGRDAQAVEFDATVRPITAEDPEFEAVGQQLVSKRQSVREGAAETIKSWMRDAVILELFPEA